VAARSQKSQQREEHRDGIRAIARGRLFESILPRSEPMTDTLEDSIEPLMNEALVPFSNALGAVTIEGNDHSLREQVAAAPAVSPHRARRRSIFASFLDALRHSRRVQARRFLHQHRHLISFYERSRAFDPPPSPESREHVDQ
jgi:hypothetical protein